MNDALNYKSIVNHVQISFAKVLAPKLYNVYTIMNPSLS